MISRRVLGDGGENVRGGQGRRDRRPRCRAGLAPLRRRRRLSRPWQRCGRPSGGGERGGQSGWARGRLVMSAHSAQMSSGTRPTRMSPLNRMQPTQIPKTASRAGNTTITTPMARPRRPRPREPVDTLTRPSSVAARSSRRRSTRRTASAAPRCGAVPPRSAGGRGAGPAGPAGWRRARARTQREVRRQRRVEPPLRRRRGPRRHHQDAGGDEPHRDVVDEAGEAGDAHAVIIHDITGGYPMGEGGLVIWTVGPLSTAPRLDQFLNRVPLIRYVRLVRVHVGANRVAPDPGGLA